MTLQLKKDLQYRKFSRSAEGEKDKNCAHCKHSECPKYILMCLIIHIEVDSRHLCDRFERG
jgi:hypothetical protein